MAGTAADGAARHGAHKTPGGKMVVVDFRVDDGVLRDVVVSGDFFLYPEEAIEPLTASLEGMPADRSADEMAQAVAAAIPAGAELLGSSPEAVAEAVRRALNPEPEEE